MSVGRAAATLFECVPVRAVRWEAESDGRVALLAPRFRNRILVRVLVPRLKRPDYRVRLDAIGTFVWQQCDGKASVAEIGERAFNEFGGEREAMEHRVADFFAQLDRERFVTLRKPGEAAPASTTATHSRPGW